MIHRAHYYPLSTIPPGYGMNNAGPADADEPNTAIYEDTPDIAIGKDEQDIELDEEYFDEEFGFLDFESDRGPTVVEADEDDDCSDSSPEDNADDYYNADENDGAESNDDNADHESKIAKSLAKTLATKKAMLKEYGYAEDYYPHTGESCQGITWRHGKISCIHQTILSLENCCTILKIPKKSGIMFSKICRQCELLNSAITR